MYLKVNALYNILLNFMRIVYVPKLHNRVLNSCIERETKCPRLIYSQTKIPIDLTKDGSLFDF